MSTIVACPTCQVEYKSNKVEFLNIEEDMQGRDLMTFRCPQCKEAVKSFIRIGYVRRLPPRENKHER